MRWGALRGEGIAGGGGSLRGAWVFGKGEIEARTALDRVDGLLTDDERAFLHMRYREGRSWDGLCRQLYASRKTLRKVRKNILAKIEKGN